VSSFVTGLVRRAAGLPQPVSIRPATVPDQIWASPSAAPEDFGSRHEALLSSAAALGEHRRDSYLGRPDLSAQAAAPQLPQPQPEAAPQPVEQWPERQSAQTNETTLRLRPRSEPTPAPVAALQIKREDRSPSRVADEVEVLPPPSLSAAPRAAALGNLERNPPTIRGDTPPTIVPSRLTLHADTFSALRPAHSLPGPESITAGRVRPAPTATASSGRDRTQESRSIQVKIGKVEIRSNQPVPVAATNRPIRASSFDDFRLARTYLDRGAR
jgi:hypothetical protein